MDYLYIDEKGPQETIRIADPYDNDKKIKLANDNMYVYVADLIMIKGRILEEVIEKKFRFLEDEYLANRRFTRLKELKGKDVIGKNFTYGIASLKSQEVNFFNSLFDILLINNVSNMVFSINKISLVLDERLRDWILTLDEKKLIESARLLKYSLNKYLEIEASESVVKSIFDSKVNNKEILTEIQKDMQTFIEKHRTNKRMKFQIQEYKKIISNIKRSKHLIKETTFDKVLFDWNKVTFNIDLWISEMELNYKFDKNNATLVLDQGIPIEPFQKLNLLKINAEEDSSKHVGLRISDILVVIVGNYISKLAIDVRYDKDNPNKRKKLSKDWFKLDEDQFNLINKMNKYFFPEDSTYCYVVDTYFDDSLLFETYIRYISSFVSYKSFNSEQIDHPEQYFMFFANAANIKYLTAIENEKYIKNLYGNMTLGIASGIVRPI